MITELRNKQTNKSNRGNRNTEEDTKINAITLFTPRAGRRNRWIRKARSETATEQSKENASHLWQKKGKSENGAKLRR